MHLRNLTASLIAAAGLIAVGSLCFGSLAVAEGLVHELKFGVLAHDVADLWSGFRAERESAAINIEALLSPSVAFFGGAIRPALGASINTVGDTSNIYLDARWQYQFSGGVFIGLGIGATVHDGQLDLVDFDQKALGSRVLFHFPAELGYRFDDHNSLSVYFEHMSNAYTFRYNEGLDRIGVRYGYRY